MKLKKWTIWRADLDPVVGSEQGKSRPVLIISEDKINELLNIVNILPITTRRPGRMIYPNESLIPAGKFGLKNDSIILCISLDITLEPEVSDKSIESVICPDLSG